LHSNYIMRMPLRYVKILIDFIETTGNAPISVIIVGQRISTITCYSCSQLLTCNDSLIYQTTNMSVRAVLFEIGLMQLNPNCVRFRSRTPQQMTPSVLNRVNPSAMLKPRAG